MPQRSRTTALGDLPATINILSDSQNRITAKLQALLTQYDAYGFPLLTPPEVTYVEHIGLHVTNHLGGQGLTCENGLQSVIDTFLGVIPVYCRIRSQAAIDVKMYWRIDPPHVAGIVDLSLVLKLADGSQKVIAVCEVKTSATLAEARLDGLSQDVGRGTVKLAKAPSGTSLSVTGPGDAERKKIIKQVRCCFLLLLVRPIARTDFRSPSACLLSCRVSYARARAFAFYHSRPRPLRGCITLPLPLLLTLRPRHG